MAGEEGKANVLADLGQKQACDLSPQLLEGWRAFPFQELPSGFRHGLLLNRGGHGERCAALKLFGVPQNVSDTIAITMWVAAFH